MFGVGQGHGQGMGVGVEFQDITTSLVLRGRCWNVFGDGVRVKIWHAVTITAALHRATQ